MSVQLQPSQVICVSMCADLYLVLASYTSFVRTCSLIAPHPHTAHTHCPSSPNSTKRTSSSFFFGTRHTQLVPKLVSLTCIHRRQHKFSYPACGGQEEEVTGDCTIWNHAQLTRGMTVRLENGFCVKANYDVRMIASSGHH